MEPPQKTRGSSPGRWGDKAEPRGLIVVVVYKITYSTAIADDLKSLAAPERSYILDEIEVQLTHVPNRETRNR